MRETPRCGPSPIEISVEGARLILHPARVTGRMFVDMYFDASAVPHPLVSWMALLASAIARPERAMNGRLAEALERHVARLDCHVTAVPARRSVGRFRPMLALETGLLTREAPRALLFLGELLRTVHQVDADQLVRLLPISLAVAAERIRSAAALAALDRAASRFSPYHRYVDLTRGIDRYLFLTGLAERWGRFRDGACAAVAAATDVVLARGGLVISVTAEERELARHESALVDVIDQLPLRARRPWTTGPVADGPRCESIPLGGRTSAAAIAADLGDNGRAHYGESAVLCTVLNTGHVWDEIRQRGGAYAAFVAIDDRGLLGCYTAGDPNPDRSLEAFRRAGRVIRNFTATRDEMSRLISGTLGRREPWDDPPGSSRRRMRGILAGETEASRARTRRAISATTVEKVRALAPVWDGAMQRAATCVLGPGPLV